MPEIVFTRFVGAQGDMLRVRIVTDRGRVITFTVQLEALIDGPYHPVARYDAAHGRPHRDTLDWDGAPDDKWWLPDWIRATANR